MCLMVIHHLFTYNISIQYVLVIHVHVTYRVCTSEVKTDEETKKSSVALTARNSNIKRCILCIWNAFSWRTGLCLLPLSILAIPMSGYIRGTKIPKGTLANRELRQRRIQAHRIFDQIWQQGILSKPEAYRWVADKFCLTDKQARTSDSSATICATSSLGIRRCFKEQPYSLPPPGSQLKGGD